MNVSRRSFLKKSVAVAGCNMLPSYATGRSKPSANSKLNVAFVGIGVQGRVNLNNISQLTNVVGVCDVNDASFGKVSELTAKVPRFKDYRVMLDKLGKDIDAVVVSTPDHNHFRAAYSAMERGKHVFVEKPLTHTVWEARKLKEAAHEFGVVTQTGNFGRASEGVRRLKELYEADVLGEVREVHAVLVPPRAHELTNKGWKLGATVKPPAGFDWDLWLGPISERPYRSCYGAFDTTWRQWWDFGSGILGDWGPHTLDGANFTFGMGAPAAVESDVAEDYSNGLKVRNWTHTVFHYPARGKKPPLKIHWYSGGKRPENKELTLPSNGSGLLFVGDKHTVQADCRSQVTRIITMNDDQWKDFKRNGMPPRTIPRVKGGHYREWINAVTGDGPTPGANFDDSGPFTEALMLGAICERAGGGRIEWDNRKMKITNNEKLNQYVNQPARKGFSV